MLDDEPVYVRTWRRLREAVALAYGAPMSDRRGRIGVAQYVSEADDVEGRLGDIGALFCAFANSLAEHMESLTRRQGPVQFLLSIDDLDMCPDRTSDVIDALRTLRSPRLCTLLTGSHDILQTSLTRIYRGSYGRVRARELSAAVIRKLLPPAQRVSLELSPNDRVSQLADEFQITDEDLRYRLTATVDAVPSTMRELADVRHELSKDTGPGILHPPSLGSRLLLHASPHASAVVYANSGHMWRGEKRLVAEVGQWLNIAIVAGQTVSRRIAGPLVRIESAGEAPPTREERRASAAALFALSEYESWAQASFSPSWSEVLGDSPYRVFRTNPFSSTYLPVPLRELGLKAALSVWGRWHFAFYRFRMVAHVRQLLWGLASLSSSSTTLAPNAGVAAIVKAGRAHANDVIKTWFHGDAYLLCLPEWGVTEEGANTLWNALGEPPAHYDLPARSLALRTAAQATPVQQAKATAELNDLWKAHTSYLAVLHCQSRATTRP
jgi:hypothetical protein